VSLPHLRDFVYHVPTLLSVKLLRVRLILKSIPFRTPTYGERRARLESDVARAKATPCGSGLRVADRLISIGGRAMRRPAAAVLRAANRLRDAVVRVRGTLELAQDRFFFRFPDAHVNYVEAARDIYGSYGVQRRRIFITYNSPDTDRLAAIRDALLKESSPPVVHARRLIHVGRLVRWKRVDMLIEAVAVLATRYPDVELLVVGDGPDRPALERLAQDRGVSARVRFVGGVYDARDLGRHLLSSVVYVLAGMGGVSLNDAMAFGRPVVCSICDGTEKHLVRDGHNGLLFAEGDAEDLRCKIEYLFQHPDRCERMGQNALETVRDEINIHTVLRGYLEAFAFVTGRRIAYTAQSVASVSAPVEATA
jgi:glycosyltransferase involved in cell wall biosynthesis